MDVKLAHLISEKGEIEVPADQIKPGDILVVKKESDFRLMGK